MCVKLILYWDVSLVVKNYYSSMPDILAQPNIISVLFSLGILHTLLSGQTKPPLFPTLLRCVCAQTLLWHFPLLFHHLTETKNLPSFKCPIIVSLLPFFIVFFLLHFFLTCNLPHFLSCSWLSASLFIKDYMAESALLSKTPNKFNRGSCSQ